MALLGNPQVTWIAREHVVARETHVVARETHVVARETHVVAREHELSRRLLGNT